jgi:hypothetical protein
MMQPGHEKPVPEKPVPEGKVVIQFHQPIDEGLSTDDYAKDRTYTVTFREMISHKIVDQCLVIYFDDHREVFPLTSIHHIDIQYNSAEYRYKMREWEGKAHLPAHLHRPSGLCVECHTRLQVND